MQELKASVGSFVADALTPDAPKTLIGADRSSAHYGGGDPTSKKHIRAFNLLAPRALLNAHRPRGLGP